MLSKRIVEYLTLRSYSKGKLDTARDHLLPGRLTLSNSPNPKDIRHTIPRSVTLPYAVAHG